MEFFDKIKNEVDEAIGKLEEVTGKITGNEAMQEWGEAKHLAAEGHLEHEEAEDGQAPTPSA